MHASSDISSNDAWFWKSLIKILILILIPIQLKIKSLIPLPIPIPIPIPAKSITLNEKYAYIKQIQYLSKDSYIHVVITEIDILKIKQFS